jgi:hypothetical protein
VVRAAISFQLGMARPSSATAAPIADRSSKTEQIGDER